MSAPEPSPESNRTDSAAEGEMPPGRTRSRRGPDTGTAGLVVVIGLLCLGLWGLFMHIPATTDESTQCLPGTREPYQRHPEWASYNYPSNPEIPPNPEVIGELSLLPDQRTTLPLGRSLEVRALDLDYTLAPIQGQVAAAFDDADLPLFLRVEVTQFLRSDAANLHEQKILAAARVVSADRVRVSICADRRDLPPDTAAQPNTEARRDDPRVVLAPPGQYAGVVSIIDPRLGRVDLPITVTLLHSNTWWVAAWMFLASVAGLWTAWLVHDKVEEQTSLQPRRFGRWIFTAIGLLCLGAGLFAAFQAFRLSYLQAPAWGEDQGSDVLALLGATFTAFVGATAGLKVAGLAARTTTRG